MTIVEAAATATNQYLSGMLAPVEKEMTAFDLDVTGTIPEHLDGRYLRNGPNPVAEVDPAAYHWFMGDGMVHGVALRDGKATWYRNRWVRSPGVSRTVGERRTGRVDSHAGMLALGANTNVLTHAGRTLALVEGGVANYELTDDLDTIGTCDFDGTLPGGYAAHPHRDPDTGELHAVSYSFARGRSVQYSVIDTSGHARRTVDIEVHGSPMMHDFSLTQKYVVLYDLPVTFDVAPIVAAQVPRWLAAPARLVMQSIIGRVKMPSPLAAALYRDTRSADAMPYSWNPKYPARIGVLPREGTGTDVHWFEIEPCYVFHPLNAYTEDRGGTETLILDVVRYDSMFQYDKRGPGDCAPTLDRWTVDLVSGVVRSERLDDRPQEFPRINETLTGKPHRYGYAVNFDLTPDATQTYARNLGVIKHDYASGTSVHSNLDSGLAIGEMCFVPNPAQADEDDGVLMGYGYHRGRQEGQLVMLDAQTLETVAIVHLPQRVPMGFHGNWAAR